MYRDLSALFFLVAGKESNEQGEKGVNISAAFPFISGETGSVVPHIPMVQVLNAPHSREVKTRGMKSGRMEFEFRVCRLQVRHWANHWASPGLSLPLCKVGTGSPLFSRAAGKVRGDHAWKGLGCAPGAQDAPKTRELTRPRLCARAGELGGHTQTRLGLVTK